jgi:excisionase family DNA binding protein
MQAKLVPVSHLVAKGLGGRSTIYKMIKSGAIPSYRVGVTGIRLCVDEVLTALRRPATLVK